MVLARRHMFTLAAGAAALLLTPAVASAAPASTHPVLGRITAINASTGSVQLSSNGQNLTLNVPSSSPVLLHEVPSALPDAKVGMTAFANVQGQSVKSLRLMQPSKRQTTTTMPVFAVDRADRIVVLATSEYGPKTLVLLPSSAHVTFTNGVVAQLSNVHQGMQVTVTGQRDTGDSYTIVGHSLSFAQ